ncbi:MAG: protein kinase [Myxococcales bacterium]|nr:protein kinase [Myxococcales bacterium]
MSQGEKAAPCPDHTLRSAGDDTLAPAAPVASEPPGAGAARGAAAAGVTTVVGHGSTGAEPTTAPYRRDPVSVEQTLAALRSSPAPRYERLAQVGRGGMGTVLRGRDRVLYREVAIKVLDPSAAQPEWVGRFVDEARITGQLEHPSIVPVHDLGIDPTTGAPYFTMKLVRGVSFAQWLASPARPVGSSERLAEGLEIFIRVCEAISYAHSRGVIHRDLKPSNLMVGEFGEVYVMDWGVARVVGPGVDVRGDTGPPTEPPEEGIVGTVAYMAPEQLSPGARCDTRTDVFGLGAILYQLVTGALPYDDKAAAQRIERARRAAYRPVYELVDERVVSRRIVQIIDRAMAFDPAARYATAAELRADVRDFLRGGLHLPTERFPAGTRIVVEGEVGDAAYVILHGEAVAYKEAPGGRRELRRMGPGEVFGEMAVLSNAPRSATVAAVEDVTAVVVTRAALTEQLGLDTWVGALLRSLASRFRDLDERLDG